MLSKRPRLDKRECACGCDGGLFPHLVPSDELIAVDSRDNVSIVNGRLCVWLPFPAPEEDAPTMPVLGGLPAIVERACHTLWRLSVWANLMGHRYTLLSTTVDAKGVVHFGFVGLDELDVQLQANAASAVITANGTSSSRPMPRPNYTRCFWAALHAAVCAAWAGDAVDESDLLALLAEAEAVHLLDHGLDNEHEVLELDARAESMLKTRAFFAVSDQQSTLAPMILVEKTGRQASRVIQRALSRLVFSHGHLFPEMPNDVAVEEDVEMAEAPARQVCCAKQAALTCGILIE
jgi:hypothetical protein